MISHADIWRAVDRLADAYGYSPSGLAKKAGLDPTAFNKSKRFSPDGKPRWPSTESIAKILGATGAAMNDFISLAEADAENENYGESCERRLPVTGFAQAGREGYFDEDGYPAGDGWNETEFPDIPAGTGHLYALEVNGDSMEPAYRKGDILIINPRAKIRRKDRVVVKSQKGEVMAKELYRRGSARVTLKSLNPEHEDVSMATGDIVWMARIIWVSQ